MQRRSIAVGILLASVIVDTASAQRMLTPTIPLNEIMPRLPPVPEPQPGQQSVEPCSFSTSVIPPGNVTPATRAEQTSDGIVLSGDGPPKTTESSSCPIPPD